MTDYRGMTDEELTTFVLANPAYKISMALKYYRDKEDWYMVDKFILARKLAKAKRLEKKLEQLRGK